MRGGFTGRCSLHRAASGLLAMVFLRALVPAGFMPDADRPFSLALCPDGFPASRFSPAMLVDLEARRQGEHHAHVEHFDRSAPRPHEHAAFNGEHCIFGAASGLAPAPQAMPVLANLVQSVPGLRRHLSPAAASARYRIAQPRAPPALS
jgi:hypothetical protein